MGAVRTTIEVLVFAVGVVVLARTVLSAVRTVVVPRVAPSALTRTVFLTTQWLFRLRVRRLDTWERRDEALAHMAPIGLLALPVVWLTVVLFSGSGMFWALGVTPYRRAFTTSGSSLLTLGFSTVDDLPKTVLAFTEATIGLILVALLISYLPTMYSAFSRRETQVALMEVRAGAPASGVGMLERYWLIGWFERIHEAWGPWELWFAELEETHTSLSALCFFRSPKPDRSWVTAAGACLDAAALVVAAVEVDDPPEASLCIRAGSNALRSIASMFGVPFDPDPRPDDPISITRDEFDEAYERLIAVGVPMQADRDQAWRDFAGWRVNYDAALLGLAALIEAPYAPWSSDRSPVPRAGDPVSASPSRRARQGPPARRADPSPTTDPSGDGTPGPSGR
jgi:fumarate reductase subunit D